MMQIYILRVCGGTTNMYSSVCDSMTIDVMYCVLPFLPLQVKHSADDLAEGETMVLTLADRKLLGERGQTLRDEEDDELENVLKVR